MIAMISKKQAQVIRLNEITLLKIVIIKQF